MQVLYQNPGSLEFMGDLCSGSEEMEVDQMTRAALNPPPELADNFLQ